MSTVKMLPRCTCGRVQARFASAAAAFAPRPSTSTSEPRPKPASSLPPRTGWGTNRTKRAIDASRNPSIDGAQPDFTSRQRNEAYKQRLVKAGLSEQKQYALARERQRQLGISHRRAAPPPQPSSSTPPPSPSTSAAQAHAHRPTQQRRPRRRQAALKKVDLPSGVIRLDNLTSLLQTKLVRIQRAGQSIGLGDVSPDRLLTSEDASLVALELGFDPRINDQTAFDLYPLPPPDDPALLEPRPPVTGIFGHVDHGKTSLLDALRRTSVAAGEAGGITQHIGAFEVRLSDLSTSSSSTPSDATITFLDTPGHAAFTAMRSRGASVTDVVVLVVAADDGVKPQTEEVIGLVKSADVGVVVAISKCDKPGVDVMRVKRDILGAGLELEEFGGDIPSVEISSKTGQGLPELLETISVLSEMRELRAERSGRAEGRVIESRVEKGRGNVATVLVLRGCLRPQASLVAGTTWARVRQLVPSSGKPLSHAYPGQPVEVTGWKELPKAGDTVLEASNEDEAKLAVSNRIERIAQAKLWQDIEVINEKRRLDDEADARRREEEQRARERGLRGNAVLAAGRAAAAAVSDDPSQAGIKELNLVVKADVSGTVEAVLGSIGDIGNKEARVKLVSSGVGDVQESDVVMARNADATIVAFNVKIPASVQKLAARAPNVNIITSPVIYRLVESVRSAVAALLPPIVETRVHGEATVQQMFEISLKGSTKKMIAGSRVSNGTFSKTRKARVVRNGETLFVGQVETLKQVKKDVDEVQKGVECGIALDGFQDWQQNDMIQSIEEIEVPRSL